MAHLLRLIVAALLLALSVSAAASVPMVRSWYAYADVYKVTGPESSQAAACAAGAAWAQANTINKGGTVWDSPTCHILNNDGGRSGSTLGIGWEGDSACPANSTPAGGACNCNTGYAEQGGACVAPNTGTDHQKECYAFSGVQTVSGGVLVSDITLTGNVADGTNLCYPTGTGNQGCAVTFGNTATASYSDGSKVSYGRYSMTDTGKKYGANNLPDYTCTAGAENTPTENKTTDGTKCNGYVGTVQGVQTCIKGTDAATGVDITGKTTTTTDSAGNKTDTKTDTKCTGNKCTTTTTSTTTNSSGATTGSSTSSSTEGKGEYCKGAGSGTAACGDGEDEKGSFSGSCAAGFTCEGDAIQCAIAKEQHARACKLFDDKSDESNLYDAEKAKGRDRDVTGALAGNETVDVKGKLDFSNPLASGQCVRDLQITVWRKDVTLPFSKVCPSLEYMGWVLVAVASLVAFRIVSGSSKEEG